MNGSARGPILMMGKAASREGVAGEGHRSTDPGGEDESGFGEVGQVAGWEACEEERYSEGGGGMGRGFRGECTDSVEAERYLRERETDGR